MEKYISKADIIEEIKIRRKEWSYGNSVEAKYKKEECDDILFVIDNIETKEVDLKKEIKEEYLKRRRYGNRDNMLVILNESQFNNIAKYFFELGLKASNPITASDRGTAEEIIINLKRVEEDYRIDLTREIEWLRNKVKKEE